MHVLTKSLMKEPAGWQSWFKGGGKKECCNNLAKLDTKLVNILQSN